ncbi:MAG: M15 family metallopeptidase [Treponema sp.]|nr:M15 family metallopeptidase [Treponema sp.]
MYRKTILKAVSGALFLFSAIFQIPAQTSGEAVPDGIVIFQKAYPDVVFTPEYDTSLKDWKISVTVPDKPGERGHGRTYEFYWCGGSMLPKVELKNKDKYWTLLYGYARELADPAGFDQEQIKAMRNFGSTDSRMNGPGTPMFFFEALYSADTKAHLEAHLKKVSFLGKTVTVHERLEAPLLRVQDRIQKAARGDKEIMDFITSIKTAEAYYWRIISGTTRKSFHSLGIAVDIQPKSLNGKQIYWSWAKEKNPDGWMLTPLSKRWIPPKKVLDIFEEEGFIWGGKWIIFDNMHFEYHPELILHNFGTFAIQN